VEFILSSDKPNVGSIAWFDLTIPDAERIKEFYEEGIRWTIEPVAMGDDENFSINPPETGDRRPVLCHRRPEWSCGFVA